jgi:hypothetical protein
MTTALLNLPGIQPFHVVRFSVNCQYGKTTVLLNINASVSAGIDGCLTREFY